MFLCSKCHPACWRWEINMAQSHGPCEGCGKVRDCVDCRQHPDQADVEAEKRALSKRRRLRKGAA